MANPNGTPANLTKQWVPGQSGNPGGRSKADAAVSNMKKLTKEQYVELLNLLVFGTYEDCQRILDSPDTSMLTISIIKVWMTIADKGDAAALDKMLDRIIGKVPNQVEVNFETVKRIKNFDGSVTEYITEQKEV